MKTYFCQSALFLIFLCSAPSYAAEPGDISFTDEVSQGLYRLRGEGKQLATRTIDFDDGYGWGAVAVAGATGLAYLYDSDVRDRLQGSRSDSFDRITEIGSIIGNPYIHLGVATAIYGGGLAVNSPKVRELGEMMGESLILADAATLILKEATGRARPLTGRDKGTFRPFSFQTDYDSFPSMHTASSFAMASVISSNSDSYLTGIAAYGAAAFVGFSRLYENNHWTSDLILGAAIGELCGRVVTRYHKSISRSVKIVPMINGEAAGLALIKRF